jgi:hypothetical protein
MAFVQRQQVLDALRGVAPDEALEPLLAEALARAGLKDVALFQPEQVALLGEELLGLAQGYLADVPQA